MIADELQELDKNGKLKMFLKAGIISVKVKCHYDIFRFYQNEMEANKKCNSCKMTSISNTAEMFRVCEKTVFNAISSMTK